MGPVPMVRTSAVTLRQESLWSFEQRRDVTCCVFLKELSSSCVEKRNQGRGGHRKPSRRPLKLSIQEMKVIAVLDSGCIWKIQLTRAPDGSAVGYRLKRGIRITP